MSNKWLRILAIALVLVMSMTLAAQARSLGRHHGQSCRCACWGRGEGHAAGYGHGGWEGNAGWEGDFPKGSRQFGQWYAKPGEGGRWMHGGGDFGEGMGWGRHHGQGMDGMHHGMGMGMDGGRGEGQRWPHPAFGVITAVSADSLTITPEVPQFVKDMLASSGMPAPDDMDKLPASLTFSLSSDTLFVQNGAKSGTDPFKVGDHVGIMPMPPHGMHGGPGMEGRGEEEHEMGEMHEGGHDMEGQGQDHDKDNGGMGMGGHEGMHSAALVFDYATAEQHMKEMGHGDHMGMGDKEHEGMGHENHDQGGDGHWKHGHDAK